MLIVSNECLFVVARPPLSHASAESAYGPHGIGCSSMAQHVALFLLLCLVRCDTKTVLQDKLEVAQFHVTSQTSNLFQNDGPALESLQNLITRAKQIYLHFLNRPAL
ncbi:unnamed protein product [Danaus chrysippus]|uniref:(African queen) hypothetical protein n=1 Tax=Danaus chrysippus TaxID=151541 RepID=A0A8J2QNB8_9NEOP|nr:unnamed protein product [Danaus chrysippus]